MDLYCKRCGELYDYYYVEHEMTPQERMRFYEPNEGCPSCIGKVVAERPAIAEAMEVAHDLLGDDTDGLAADGFRLAWEATGLRMPPTDEYNHLGLPASTIKVLQTLWKRAAKQPDITVSMGDLTTEPSMQLASLAVAKRPMMVSYANNRMCFRWGNVSLTSQLVQGDFPDYKGLIPGGGDHKVVVDAEQFLRALNQVSHVASGGSNIVRLAWEARTLTVSARGEELDDAEVTLSASTQGDGSHIAFSWGLLRNYLSAKDGNIMLETTTPSSPALFTYRSQPHVVIMPMFVEWDGGPDEAPSAETTASAEATRQARKPKRQSAAEINQTLGLCREDAARSTQPRAISLVSSVIWLETIIMQDQSSAK